MFDLLRKRLPLILFAALFGAVGIVMLQERAGYRMTITDFLGSQIVEKGGYGAHLASLIGWSCHFWVCLAWSAIYAFCTNIFPIHARAVRWFAAAIISVLLANAATMLSGPINQILVAVISRKGFPKELPPYTPVELSDGRMSVFGLFLVFFAICFLVLIVFHDLTLPRPRLKQAAGADTAEADGE